MMYENKYYINNKSNLVATTWLMILIILLLIFLNIFFNYKYKKYDEYLGYIKNINGFKMVFYIEVDELSKISSYDLKVNNLKYNFEIESISEQYYIINNKNFYEIVLKIDLDKKLLIENNIINFIFEKDTTTLYKELKKGIRKWIN